jgi:hypothetical protein
MEFNRSGGFVHGDSPVSFQDALRQGKPDISILLEADILK